MGKVSCMVQIGAEKLEARELDLPPAPIDGAIMKVEAVGVCGSDVRQYLQSPKGARILGHEPVGTITAIGDVARRMWDLREGDRVALEEYIVCGQCEWCRVGEYRHCFRSDVSNNPEALKYGSTPMAVTPGLWGGYAQFMYVPNGATIHRVPDGITPELATLFIALGNGFQWTTVEGRLRPGESILIQGPGQMGAACAAVARAVGAERVIVTGKSSDGDRLDVCRRLGADVTIDVDNEDTVERVRDVTNGRGVDVTIDATARAGVEPLRVAMDVLKQRGGRMVVQGGGRVKEFPLETMMAHYMSLQTARGHSFASVELGLQLLASKRLPFSLMHTHDFPLAEAEAAVLATKGDIVMGTRALHVGILPWRN